jgi:hypothetical protein
MANVFIYDPATGKGKEILFSVNTPDYQGQPGVLVNPDATLIKTVSPEYLKYTGGRLAEMTAAEKAAVDAAKPPVPPDPMETMKNDIADLKQRVSNLEKP